MSYLKEFHSLILKRDLTKFLVLWEEYCNNDQVDVEEMVNLLKMIKGSELAPSFGKHVEMALPLWEHAQDGIDKYKIFKLLIDLQNNNSEQLAELTMQLLQEKYKDDPEFLERIRLIGLRPIGNFQGALSNYDLLAHMKKGKFVYHTAGWGTGEIMEISPLREMLTCEFEYVAGRKHLTFSNAFKTLTPLEDDSFLARRFGDPDALEKEAKENPLAVIHLLLKDLGPQTAGEIKDELCDLVIPEAEWGRWWQATRAKLKKDTLIETPSSLRDPFILRKNAVSHESILQEAMDETSDINEIILTSYNFVRDFPQKLKQEEVRNSIKDKLIGLLKNPDINKAQELQVHIFLEELFNEQSETLSVEQMIKSLERVDIVINAIDIIAFKKRTLNAVHEYREDWKELFSTLLFKMQQSQLRDYLLNELNKEGTKEILHAKITELLENPITCPEALVWYFQKLLAKGNKDLPYADKDGISRFFESFMILFHTIESDPNYRDLTKKMYNILLAKRYLVVREILEGTSLEYTKEFLLLASKCLTLAGHDMKILRSLAEVVHPTLGPKKKRKDRTSLDGHVLWTTEEGYLRTQERAKQIGTVEIVENSREVEEARSHGDLRENAEYKFAVEKRANLQRELKTLSEQLNKARIITPQDIENDEVGIGNIVDLVKKDGSTISYTILGPWDADTEKNILSFQSKLAQAMVGLKAGDTFTFKDEEYTIAGMRSFME
ncbi:MAG: GreA/GreB family elongation factor [Chlamydiales bacterium]|nr:GreA/GreB family elongation factor [Chlamydiia bacterium]MCP5507378.1 GreA/GreB family elongation factor [Chlamydiales bacterium]